MAYSDYNIRALEAPDYARRKPVEEPAADVKREEYDENENVQDGVLTDTADAVGELEELFKGFDDLESLLSTALDMAQGKKALRAAQAKKAKGNLTASEMKEIDETLAKWESRIDWEPIAEIALFEKETCSHCGLQTFSFLSLLQKQRHRSKPATCRALQVPVHDSTLPKETRYTSITVPMCKGCIAQHGFDLLTATPHERGLS